jgi:hypothetical protein
LKYEKVTLNIFNIKSNLVIIIHKQFK